MNAPVRQVHSLIQGSDEWHRFRFEHDGASEAAAMLGLSKKTTRNELLKIKATGVAKEFSDWVQKNILDHGHAVESKARVILEGILGEYLYPATMSYGLLSASCDGLTMDGDIAFEHKQINQALLESVRNGILPEEHQPQCQQILHVTGAKKLIFTVSDGTEENCARMDVFPDEQWVKTIEAGWAQFRIDRAEYKPAPAVVEVIGREPDALPALHIHVMGMVKASNLAEFQEQAIARFKSINTDLQTDQDFADAELAIKFCDNIEGKLKLAKEQALSQTESIDQLFRAVDAITAEARNKRLALEKLVKQRKEELRADIAAKARDSAFAYIDGLNENLAVSVLVPDSLVFDIGAAMKGKKTVQSLRDAASQVVANVKIAAKASAERQRANLEVLATINRPELFGDREALVRGKTTEDLRNLATTRVAEADRQAEERQRIADQAKAQAVAPVIETPSPSASASAEAHPAHHSASPAMASGAQALAKIKLGDINERIAPLSITADGLTKLGFSPVGTEKTAKLYNAADLPRILVAMGQHIKAVHQAVAPRAAA